MNFRQSTIKYVKDILRARTIYEVIAKELQEAHLRKLEAETAAEYANAAIQYNDRRIERLKQRLFEHAEDTW
jgi:tRNA(Phe) wybutosine-synthesizing methylase Tyw3